MPTISEADMFIIAVAELINAVELTVPTAAKQTAYLTTPKLTWSSVISNQKVHYMWEDVNCFTDVPLSIGTNTRGCILN